MHLINSENCPICGSKLKCYSLKKSGDVFENTNDYTLECKNDCFFYSYYNYEADVRIFEKKFYCGNILSLEISNRVKEKIDYWKENDRYLLEILTK